MDFILLEFYRRDDSERLWAWRLTSGADIVATDGGQGYENKQDCIDRANDVVNGLYAKARRVVITDDA